jgi:hypothetical protein
MRGAGGMGFAAAALGLAAFFMPGLPGWRDVLQAQSMALPGKMGVSETGAATYEIPITVPPGTAGMVPSLSLSYNSQSGNGLLGMGWQLEGLPSLGRCPRTLAQDGVRGGVNFDANDRFCLDGQRLIAISGSYGADGSEYRTEVESFAKVVAHGAAGTGPAWFEVRTKTGQIMEFGNTADSRILVQGKAEARSWAVNKVSDTKGNFYTISYVNDAASGEAYPSRIDYTGNVAAGLTPYNSVRFVYTSDRPDKSTGYHAGAMVKATVRMSKVQTYAGSSLVADYRLAYQTGSATGRSQLANVTLCDGTGTCLPATNFSWQNGTLNYTTVSNVGGQDGTLSRYNPYIADFNGDGLADVFWDSGLDSSQSNSAGSHVLWTNTGNGTFQVTSNWLGQDGTTVSSGAGSCANILSRSSFFQPLIADFNRDGRADIWWYNSRCGIDPSDPASINSPTIQWFSQANGNYLINVGPIKNNYRDDNNTPQPFAPKVLEVNGDGWADIIWSAPQRDEQATWQTQSSGMVSENTFSGFPGGSNFINISNVLMKNHVVDFNSDGFTDFLWLRVLLPPRIMNALWFGNGDGTFREVAGQDTTIQDYSPSYGDLNGDGQTDILWDKEDIYGRSKGSRILWLSRGDGTFDKISNAGGQDGTLASSTHRPYLVDFNGDGLTDVLWDAEDDNSTRSTGERVLWLNRGENQFTVIANLSGQNGMLIDYAPGFADFNGDGKTDLFWDKQVEDDSRSQGLRVLWMSDGIVPDLMIGTTNGVGATASISYKPLTDGTVYTRDNGAVDPVVDLQGAMPVVARLNQSNGIGGQVSLSYAYVGARAHQDGRGYLGFRQVKVTDLQTGIVQTTTYRQDYPFIGLVASDAKTLRALTLSTTANTYIATDLGSTRKQVSLAQSQASSTDLNGVALPSVTSSYQYDAYGNATQITVASSDGYAKTTTNTYTNDTANWLLGRLATATVTSTAPAVESQAPAEDTTPNPFDFTDADNVGVSTVQESSAIVTGFNRPLTARVSGGNAQIRKNGTGQWASSADLRPGDTLNIRMTASGSFSTAVTAMVVVGSASVNWRVTTIAGDTTPDPFDFVDVNNSTVSTVYETSTVISGINTAVTATVSGGNAQIRKGGAGDWGSSVSVTSGDTLNVRMTSSSAAGTAVSATVVVGSISANWIVSNSRVITVSSNVNDFNLRSAHDALYAAPTGNESPPVHVRVVIEANVIVGTTGTTTPAFNVGSWPQGIQIQIINRGLIIGAGGNGNPGGIILAPPGSVNGGTAFYTRYPIRLDNAQGNIAGGGGGGGGGAGGGFSDTAGGGGGGAGVPGGVGGTGNPAARAGTPGTTLVGGNGASQAGGTPYAGGSGFGIAGSNGGGRGGGGGGGPGAAGGNGAGQNGRAGGQPGVAVDGDGFVTYDGVGGVWGPRASGS